MTKKITDYSTLRAGSINELTQHIKNHIGIGWEPHGQMFSVYQPDLSGGTAGTGMKSWCQGMVKVEFIKEG